MASLSTVDPTHVETARRLIIDNDIRLSFIKENAPVEYLASSNETQREAIA